MSLCPGFPRSRTIFFQLRWTLFLCQGGLDRWTLGRLPGHEQTAENEGGIAVPKARSHPTGLTAYECSGFMRFLYLLVEDTYAFSSEETALQLLVESIMPVGSESTYTKWGIL